MNGCLLFWINTIVKIFINKNYDFVVTNQFVYLSLN